MKIAVIKTCLIISLFFFFVSSVIFPPSVFACEGCSPNCPCEGWSNNHDCVVGGNYCKAQGLSCAWHNCCTENPDGTCSPGDCCKCGCPGGPPPDDPPPPPDECNPEPCNGNKVDMSVSPQIVQLGQPINFYVGGEQGSLYIEDLFTGGVNCQGFTGDWPKSQTCQTTASGTFTWTHHWKSCACDFDHCTGLCSKTVSYTIITPTPTPTPTPIPCPVTINATCNQDTANFSWSSVSGAASYLLRSNKEPFDIWNPSDPASGDFTNQNANTSYSHQVEPNANYLWSIHPVGVGESYYPFRPNVCNAPSALNCPLAKTCTADVSKAIYNQTESITLSATGTGNQRSGENVRLWLEQSSGNRLSPTPAGSTESYYSGKYYYQLSQCNSSGLSQCTTSSTVQNLPAGTYKIHCDVPVEPPKYKCSGNPFCSHEGGTDSCPGWQSCSLNDSSSFRINSTPNFSNPNLRILNNINAPVNSQNYTLNGINYTGNHICDSRFLNLWVAKFEIEVRDADSFRDIAKIYLRLRNGANTNEFHADFNSSGSMIASQNPSSATWNIPVFSATSSTVNPITRGVVFYADFGSNYGPVTFDIDIYSEDFNGANTGWIPVNRKLKIWDCRVPIGGTLYDNSLGLSCANYTKTGLEESMNLRRIIFNDPSTPPQDVLVDPVPGTGNYTTILLWDKNYIPTFNDPPLPKLEASGLEWRHRDTGINASWICNQSTVSINNTTLNPYSDRPNMQLDFAAVRNQDPWFQTIGGGVKSSQIITNNIPPTCSGACKPATIINSPDNYMPDSLVSGTDILNNSGCDDQCQHTSPNDWYIHSNLIADKSDFNSFYNKYYLEMQQGKLIDGDTDMTTVLNEIQDVGDTGVVFVKGNLNVDTNNTLDPGKLIMIIASGQINFDIGTTSSAGVFVADGNISATTPPDTPNPRPLQIDGILYSAHGMVSLNRNLKTETNGAANNSAPGVVVKYRPDFIFNLPAKLSRLFYLWKAY